MWQIEFYDKFLLFQLLFFFAVKKKLKYLKIKMFLALITGFGIEQQ